MLDVALLGTGGMMPLPNRFLTSLLLRLNGKMLLIDCGEGTQITMKMLGWGFKNLDVILITHFHADHVSGLPGLLLTLGNSGRTEPLTIIGPFGLHEILKGLLIIASDLPFEIHVCHFGEHAQMEAKIGEYNISAYTMHHRTVCLGYSIGINRKGKFNLEKAQRLNIPKKYWNLLQKNETVEYEGKVYTPDMVLGEPRKGIKVSYCTDSRPVEGLDSFVAGSDLFICEGIYGEDEKKDKAIAYKHMLFSEAAEIAKAGGVKELWLTHFSPSLTDPKMFLQNARDVFYNTVTGYDRITKTILFTEQ